MYNLTYFRNTTAHLLSVLVLFFVGTASAHAADPVPSLKSPFLFVENAGQVVDADGALQPDVLYVLEQGDMTVFVRSNGLSYQFTHSEYTDGTDGTPIPKYTRFLRTKYESHRVDLQLVNASTDARVTREQLSEYFEQFFLPQCQAGVKAATCERLVVHDVYPNIDWVLYLKDGGLKYDFVVRAGGDPAVIAMH